MRKQKDKWSVFPSMVQLHTHGTRFSPVLSMENFFYASYMHGTFLNPQSHYMHRTMALQDLIGRIVCMRVAWGRALRKQEHPLRSPLGLQWDPTRTCCLGVCTSTRIWGYVDAVTVSLHGYVYFSAQAGRLDG